MSRVLFLAAALLVGDVFAEHPPGPERPKSGLRPLAERSDPTAPFGDKTPPQGEGAYDPKLAGACNGITAFDLWYAATTEAAGLTRSFDEVVESVIEERRKPGSQTQRPELVRLADGTTKPLTEPGVVKAIAAEVQRRFYPGMEGKSQKQLAVPADSLKALAASPSTFRKATELVAAVKTRQAASAAGATALWVDAKHGSHSISARVTTDDVLMISDPNSKTGAFVPATLTTTDAMGVRTLQLSYEIPDAKGKVRKMSWPMVRLAGLPPPPPKAGGAAVQAER